MMWSFAFCNWVSCEVEDDEKTMKERETNQRGECRKGAMQRVHIFAIILERIRLDWNELGLFSLQKP